MNTPIYADTSLADAFDKAGLDIRNAEDVRLFQEATLAVKRQGETVSSVALQVTKNKTATETLDEHFADFRKQERSLNPTPQPQLKDQDKSYFEGLEKYFTEWRKSNIKKEG